MPKPMTQVLPDPKLEKRGRRSFTAEYKLSILQQADACQHGELGPLLRREKLYSNQLAQWRREFAEQAVAGLNKPQPGPAAVKQLNKSALNSWKKNLDVCAVNLTLRTAASRSKKNLGTDRSLRSRELVAMMVAESLPCGITERLACRVLNLCRNTVRSVRQRLSFIGPQELPSRCRKNAVQPKALDTHEQQQVLDVLNNEIYCNQPPMQVYHNLLQQGRYLCSGAPCIACYANGICKANDALNAHHNRI
jgi:transposase-like protein